MSCHDTSNTLDINAASAFVWVAIYTSRCSSIHPQWQLMSRAYRILYKDSWHPSCHTLITLLISLVDPSQFTGFLRKRTDLPQVTNITVKPSIPRILKEYRMLYIYIYRILQNICKWMNTTTRHQSQPLMTAIGLSLIHFLLIPAAWQVSTTSVTFLYDSGASSMTNLGDATRMEIPISSSLCSTSL